MKLTLLACVVTLIWLWKRGHFERENLVTEPTLRRIRRDSALDTSEHEQAEMTRGKREVIDGPMSRYDRVVSR